MLRCPDGLQAVKPVAKQLGLHLQGASGNRDGGFDAPHTRTLICKADLIPHITEKPRHRTITKRGRQRCFNAAIHAWRRRVERTCAWADTFKRRRRRFERIQQRHDGMKLMAYMLINLRAFCRT